jgi:DNA-binding IclR family transcriptional regulator
MTERPASGDGAGEGASLTPTAIRMIWTLYTLERRNGHEWVHVAELARQLALAPEAVHRILMQIRPRRALRRSTEHPRKWRIGEQGRSVCRTIESIARALQAELRDG